jgi:hypothetical protein
MTDLRLQRRSPKGMRVTRAAVPGIAPGGTPDDRDRTCAREVRA